MSFWLLEDERKLSGETKGTDVSGSNRARMLPVVLEETSPLE